MKESPSDSVNGVNADVPLDNDGGEKVVGARLVDESGPMEKRPQMTKDKHIIIPFPFGGSEIRLRKKRDAHIRAMLFSISAFLVLDFATAFESTVHWGGGRFRGGGTYSHGYGGSNSGRSGRGGVFAGLIVGAMVILMLFVFGLYKCIMWKRNRRTAGAGSGSNVQMNPFN